MDLFECGIDDLRQKSLVEMLVIVRLGICDVKHSSDDRLAPSTYRRGLRSLVDNLARASRDRLDD